MREHDADDGAHALRRDVRRRVSRSKPAVSPFRARDRRIEVRAGHWAECQDQGDERGRRRHRVRQQRQCDVPTGERLRHDARADDCGEEQRGSDRLGRQPAAQGDLILAAHTACLLSADASGLRFGRSLTEHAPSRIATFSFFRSRLKLGSRSNTARRYSKSRLWLFPEGASR